VSDNVFSNTAFHDFYEGLKNHWIVDYYADPQLGTRILRKITKRIGKSSKSLWST